MNCPCGTGKAYAKCCQIFHLGAYPDTAEQLMRSRYSAYALRDAQYLIKTHQLPEKDKESELLELLQFLPTCEWLELKMLLFYQYLLAHLPKYLSHLMLLESPIAGP